MQQEAIVITISCKMGDRRLSEKFLEYYDKEEGFDVSTSGPISGLVEQMVKEFIGEGNGPADDLDVLVKTSKVWV